MHNSVNMDSFGSLLKSYRLTKGYSTQSDLAEALGISRGTVSNWESSKRLPRYRDEVLHIRDVLELTISEVNRLLIAGNFPPEGPTGNNRPDILQGIARLPFGYVGRIQNFLDDYLSAPFGGRDQELKKLDNWLFDKNAPPYLLVASEAGRGKSALLAHWMKTVQNRKLAEIAFIPVSIRYNTSQASVVFASLASRLGEIYSDPITIDHFSADRWKEICLHFLERKPPINKPILVILDGLDEASDWHAGYDLVPFHPESGIRVVVSSRFLAGDVDETGWLQRLGWDKPGRAIFMDLPLLSEQGVMDVLKGMGNPLDKLSVKADILQELFRLTEGDPLLLRLYVDALTSFGEQVATLKPEDLNGMETGLKGYFEQWWKDQRVCWGDKHPLKERLVSTLLNLFACALAPLLTRDILAIAPKDIGLNTWTIEDGIDPLRRFIIGDGKNHGFVFNHSRLANFFYEKLDSEQVDWEACFLEYGKHTLEALSKDPGNYQNCSLYALQTYGAHLERSKKASGEFYALITEGWMRAWYQKTGTYTGFLTDVDRAWKRANLEKEIAIQVKCALCHSSVQGISSNIQPELLKLSLQHGLLDGVQALMIIEQTMDDDLKANQIIEMFSFLKSEQQQSAFQAAQFIRDERARVKALTGIASYLVPDLLSSAIQHIQYIKDIGTKAEAFLGFASFLTNDQIITALQASCGYQYEWERIEYIRRLVGQDNSNLLRAMLRAMQLEKDERLLADLIIALSSFGSSNLSGALQKLINNIKNKSERVRAISGLSAHLSQEIILETLRETKNIIDLWEQVETVKRLVTYIQSDSLIIAINVIQEIQYEWIRAIALTWLEKYMPDSLLPIILKAAEKIHDEKSRTEVLIGLIPHLPLDQRPNFTINILVGTKKIRDGFACAVAISNLAGYLTHDAIPLALQVIQEIQSEQERSQAYIGLIVNLPPELRPSVVDILLHSITSIEDEKESARILIGLLPYLSHESISLTLQIISGMRDDLLKSITLSNLSNYLATELMPEALKIAKDMANALARSRALTCLSAHLSFEQQSGILIEALNAAQYIQDDFPRAIAISELAEFLPSDKLLVAVEAAKDIHNETALALAYKKMAPHLSKNSVQIVLNDILKIRNEKARVDAIAGVSSYLPLETIPSVLNSLAQINDETARTIAYSSLAAHLSPSDFPAILEAINNIQNVWDQVDCLRNLVAHLPCEQLPSTIVLSTHLQNNWARARALIALAPYLPIELLPNAIEATQLIEDERARAEALAEITSRLPRELLPNALQAVQLIHDQRVLAEALAGITSHLPDELLPDALKAAQNIPDERARSEALVKLAPYLPEDLLSDALDNAKNMRYQQSRARALAGLAIYLPANQKPYVLMEALNVAQTVADVVIIPNILLELVNYLPLENQKDAIRKAFSKTMYIQDERIRAKTLAKLADQLPVNIYKEAFNIARDIQDEWARAEAIIGLAAYLPDEILVDALDEAQKIRHEWARANIFSILARNLEKLAKKDFEVSYSIWLDFLRKESCVLRYVILSDISQLTPFLMTFIKETGKINTPEDIIHGIKDVSHWWP